MCCCAVWLVVDIFLTEGGRVSERECCYIVIVVVIVGGVEGER